MLDLTDPDFRESLAREAYFRDRAEDAALDLEHDLDGDARYFALDWSCLSSGAQRPYRSGVAAACNAIAAALQEAM